jgi:hypothetical protein
LIEKQDVVDFSPERDEVCAAQKGVIAASILELLLSAV